MYKSDAPHRVDPAFPTRRAVVSFDHDVGGRSTLVDGQHRSTKTPLQLLVWSMYTQAWYSVDTSPCKSTTITRINSSTAILDFTLSTNLTYMLASNL